MSSKIPIVSWTMSVCESVNPYLSACLWRTHSWSKQFTERKILQHTFTCMHQCTTFEPICFWDDILKTINKNRRGSWSITYMSEQRTHATLSTQYNRYFEASVLLQGTTSKIHILSWINSLIKSTKIQRKEIFSIWHQFPCFTRVILEQSL